MPKMTALSFTHTTYGKPRIRVDRGGHVYGHLEQASCFITMQEAMLVCKWAEDYIHSHEGVYFSLYPCGFYMAVQYHKEQAP